MGSLVSSDRNIRQSINHLSSHRYKNYQMDKEYNLQHSLSLLHYHMFHSDISLDFSFQRYNSASTDTLQGMLSFQDKTFPPDKTDKLSLQNLDLKYQQDSPEEPTIQKDIAWKVDKNSLQHRSLEKELLTLQYTPTTIASFCIIMSISVDCINGKTYMTSTAKSTGKPINRRRAFRSIQTIVSWRTKAFR